MGTKTLLIDHNLIDEDLLDFPVAIDLLDKVPELCNDLGENKYKFTIKVDTPDTFTELLIHSDTFNGDTNFVDSSKNNFTITPYGDIIHSTVQSKIGASSMYFDGSNNFLSIDYFPNFGTEDFTIEWWEYLLTTADEYAPVFQTDKNSTTSTRCGLMLGYNFGGKSTIYACSDPNAWDIANGVEIAPLDPNTWHHKAFVRQGDTFYIFYDGSLVSTFTSSLPIYQCNGVGLGGHNTDYFLSAYIDEFRVSIGTARWTENFTPPTQPYPNISECYNEIECWEPTNKVIHTKVPRIEKDNDTYLTVEWDATWDDNTTFVGETGSDAAKNVWDNNYVAVYHMAQDPSSGTILDSTSNALNGTVYGSMTNEELIDGILGKAIEFDGVDDYIEGTLPSFNQFTGLISFKLTEQIASERGLLSGEDAKIAINMMNNNTLRFLTNYSWVTSRDVTVDPINMDNHIYVGRTDGNLIDYLWDGVKVRSDSVAGSIDASTLRIARYGDTYTKSLYYEVRISKIARSDAWIKATNYNLTNYFVTVAQDYTIKPLYSQIHIKDLILPYKYWLSQTGRRNEVCFCLETMTGYAFVENGAAYTVNNTSVLNTVQGGDTRWVGVYGQYNYFG